MSGQFLYFIVVEGNKDLLKEEIKFFYKNFTLSFSKGQFITYKNNGSRLTATQIQNLPIVFALDWGESIFPLNEDFINSKLLSTEIPLLPANAPSRAYLKIKQALAKFPVNEQNANWIEFGSSPGGASLYLLENFNQVVGVDPAEMDEVCLKNSNFTHLQKPIQNISKEDFNDTNYQYVASDLNLNPKQAIEEVLRVTTFFEQVRCIYMTVKMVKANHVKLIKVFENMFKEKKFKTIKAQLSSHRREFLIYAYK